MDLTKNADIVFIDYFTGRKLDNFFLIEHITHCFQLIPCFV